ncbi:ATP-binding cassette domain-containing protein [Legionella tunisiensis]|uniref:ATP-binding cassette domain-containing protein n=1 Tax=Legionella tunisiensis TaxID=1034944 RepID=UPI00030D9338|nr:ATP-binding cassette domain-containing protein [Legionella tunisiensis]
MSGGQRQSIAIARALLRNPNILLLDEPTSAMDDNSERRFKTQLTEHMTENHTLLLVTHKFSMLELVNRIIILDDGKLIADGPKESVLSALKAGMTVERETK